MTPELYTEAIAWLAIITVFAGVLTIGGFIADRFEDD